MLLRDLHPPEDVEDGPQTGHRATFCESSQVFVKGYYRRKS